jgi:hypothetical protein
MALTAALGTADSRLGNISLGSASSSGGGGPASSLVYRIQISAINQEEINGLVLFSKSMPFAVEVPYPRASRVVRGDQTQIDGVVASMRPRPVVTQTARPASSWVVSGELINIPGLVVRTLIRATPDNVPRPRMIQCSGEITSTEGRASRIMALPTAVALSARIPTTLVFQSNVPLFEGFVQLITQDPALVDQNIRPRQTLVVLGEIETFGGLVIPRTNPVQPDLGGLGVGPIRADANPDNRGRPAESVSISIRPINQQDDRGRPPDNASSGRRR